MSDVHRRKVMALQEQALAAADDLEDVRFCQCRTCVGNEAAPGAVLKAARRLEKRARRLRKALEAST